MTPAESPIEKTDYQQMAMDYAEQFLDRLMHVETIAGRRMKNEELRMKNKSNKKDGEKNDD